MKIKGPAAAGIAYQVGKHYLVPTVYGRWFNASGHWPVLGSFHEDSEHIGFAYWHYHVDARFLSDSVFRRIGSHRDLAATCAANPLMLNAGSRTSYFGRENAPTVALRRRKCQRELGYVPLLDTAPWQAKLENAHSQKRLINGRCPHRGADLSRVTPDKHGCIACPLHGLVFKADTGEMVPRAEWLRMRQECTT